MQIFISYKSENWPFVSQLRDQLQSWGFSTWLDKDNIRDGYYWRDEIDVGLAASSIVVGVVTPDSVDSRHVLNEWYTAIDTDKRLLLLILEETDLRSRFSLNQIQRIDFTSEVFTAFHKLRQTLESKYEPSHSVNKKTLEQPAPRELNNRSRLLQKVHDFWVKGVLENALRESGEFDLGLQISPGAVLKHKDYGDYHLNSSAHVSRIFQDMNREMLILGAPGSGKTILLLQVARRLIEEAIANEKQPMPVVFNLSSWAVERRRLEEWLKDELRNKYQVPKKVAHQWVEGEKLLLLLDGLDEVSETYREVCVDAINVFRHEFKLVDMIVCSRILDYEVLSRKLDLQGAILLQPLTMQQIETYLQRKELAELKEVMTTDEILQEFARTPFLLNTMAFAYQNLSAINLKLPPAENNEAGRRTHLFNNYVDKRLSQFGDSTRYTPRQSRHYLQWLGKKMVVWQQTVFYLENLQPNWLETNREQLKNRFGVKLGIGLSYGISFGVLYGTLISAAYALNGNMAEGLAYGVRVALALGLSLTILTGLPVSIYEIEVADTLNIRWSREDILWGVLNALGTGVVVTLIGSIFHEVLISASIGVSTGLVSFLSAGLHSAEDIELRSSPNRGLRRLVMKTLQTAVIVALLIGGSSLITVSLLLNVPTGIAVALIVGTGFGLSLALSWGLRSAVRHLVLRLLLYEHGYAPMNYADFLDYATKDLFILRKVGGGYIFIHRYLLDYFAEEYDKADYHHGSKVI